MHDRTQSRADESLVLVRLKGRLDCPGIEALSKRLDRVVVPQDGGVLIDFSKVSFVDGLALACFIMLARRVRGEGGELALFGLSDGVRRSFEVARLHQLLDILADEESARQVLQ